MFRTRPFRVKYTFELAPDSAPARSGYPDEQRVEYRGLTGTIRTEHHPEFNFGADSGDPGEPNRLTYSGPPDQIPPST